MPYIQSKPYRYKEKATITMNLRRKLRGKGAGIAIRASILSLFLIVGTMNLLGGIWNYTAILCWALADNALVSSMAF
jgi:hypothetical protein